MSYFRENIESAAGYTPGFQPKDDNIVKLNTNENPYPPCPGVLEAISQINTEQLRRYPDPLGDKFRKAAAKLNGVTMDSIMCCNGGDDLLNITIRAFCDEVHALAYPVPTYSLYPVLARIQNCPIIEIPFNQDFQLPKMLCNTGANLTIVCNPNAPSASIITPEILGDLAGKLNGILLIDEAYTDFAQYNCVKLIKTFDNIIILRSMSKGYSLAGIRFGYAIAHPDLIAGLMKIKDSYNVDVLAIEAACAAIKDQEYFLKNINKIKENRSDLTRDLQNLGFNVSKSHSNFVLAQTNDKPALMIYNALKERNIFVRYFQVPGLDDKLRISIGTKEQNSKLISALKEILI